MFVLSEQSDVFIDAMASDHHAQLLFCPRRPNFDPPYRLNFDPGLVAEIA